jgi:glutathione S-transferase
MDVQRILKIWDDARKKTVERVNIGNVKDEGFLCGEFGVVDASFWPVLWVRIPLLAEPILSPRPSWNR